MLNQMLDQMKRRRNDAIDTAAYFRDGDSRIPPTVKENAVRLWSEEAARMENRIREFVVYYKSRYPWLKIEE